MLEAKLSPREEQIVALVVDDLSHKEIAQILCLSVRTVEHYITEIAAKIPGRGGGARKIRRVFSGPVQVKPAPPPRPDPRWVYFVEAVGAGKVKIGVAGDPLKRLRQLAAGSPGPLRLLGVEPGGIVREGELHVEFADLHHRGEWFDAEPPLREYIARCATPYNPPS